MNTVTSADGTRIAFDHSGAGPAVIVVGGAFNDRTTVAGLAQELSPDFTAIAYDRRGRGDSGDAGNYSVQREIEDIAALIEHAGGSASLVGHSSGAILSLLAAAELTVDKVVVYEPPFITDDTRPRPGADIADRVQALVDADRRDDAAMLFFTEGVNVPAEILDRMRNHENWAWFSGLAHTLPYDLAICGPGNALPTDSLAKITAPTLVICGGASLEWVRTSGRAAAGLVHGGRYLTLEGQDHGSVLQQPGTLAPTVREFLVPGEVKS
jgi:pimeloyl-ACP methyl ester carboxylesterase